MFMEDPTNEIWLKVASSIETHNWNNIIFEIVTPERFYRQNSILPRVKYDQAESVVCRHYWL